MKTKSRARGHARIGIRLSARIFAVQLGCFIAVDFVLFLLISLRHVNTLPAADAGLERVLYWVDWLVARAPWLDVTSYWALVALGAVEALCLLHATLGLRGAVKEQMEPLREVRAAHDDIEERYNRLEEAFAAQSRFVSDASHELRTPIAVIQGYANILARWGADDPMTRTESIEAIRTESESMKRLVNQLLFLARGDSNTLAVDRQRMEVAPVLREVLREARVVESDVYGEGRVAAGDGAGCAWHTGRHKIRDGIMGAPVYIMGDAALIKQLVRILFDNSVRYTPEGGEIKVSLDADARHVYISVQDEGQGIPEAVLPHVFDRFARADEARTRNSGGSGLGLSIAKQIAERHDGRIDAVSREGIGTRFTVTLDRA